VAHVQDGAKLNAPSAERNAEPLTKVLLSVAPRRGKALELASGTGQHVIAFAVALPDLKWQPTEIDPISRASIDAYVQDAGLANVAPAKDLNATAHGWAQAYQWQDLILLSNLLHLISTPETQTLLTQVAQALSPGGVLILYGPFIRDGELTSDGDRQFDADLRAADPAIGYKDTTDIARWLTDAGLTAPVHHAMPANNLALIATKAR
jgi:hypothetical protein